MTEKTATRRFRFRTRTLFVLIVIASLPCWVCSIWVSRSRYQRDLRIELQRAGARVYHGIVDDEPAVQTWFRERLGDDYFLSVQTIWHIGPGIDDGQLESIANLYGVRWLSLQGANVTDIGVGHVSRMRTLDDLDLSATNTTDNGLRHVGKLANLSTLSLSHTAIADRGLEHLARLRSLRRLDVENTYVTAEGITDLQRRIPGLVVMWSHASNVKQHAALVQFARLGGYYVTVDYSMAMVHDEEWLGDNADLAILQRVTDLECVSIVWEDITAEGIDQLGKCPSLVQLTIHSTALSDAELQHLTSLTSLRDLQVHSKNITDVGIAHLATLGSLEQLELDVGRSAGITGRSFDHLIQLPNLDTLRLWNLRLKDSDLSRLKHFPRLLRLDLRYGAFTDAAVDHLVELKDLVELDLAGTQITAAGAERLRAALPNCEITGLPQ